MRISILLALLLLAACTQETLAQRSTPIVGGPCEDCQVALEGLPHRPPVIATLASQGEPGERLRLTGVVVDEAHRPREGVIVYAYQTDHSGNYPSSTAPLSDAAQRHGRLRAWAMTDADGTYTFLTIRPGGYPGSDLPQHIHMHVIEPGCATYYLDDVMFHDDPRLTPRFIAQLDVGRGGSGIVAPIMRDGVWHVRRDIILGYRIPDYPRCQPVQTTGAQ